MAHLWFSPNDRLGFRMPLSLDLFEDLHHDEQGNRQNQRFSPLQEGDRLNAQDCLHKRYVYSGNMDALRSSFPISALTMLPVLSLMPTTATRRGWKIRSRLY